MSRNPNCLWKIIEPVLGQGILITVTINLTHLSFAVGTTFDVFSYDANCAVIQTHHLAKNERRHYVLSYNLGSLSMIVPGINYTVCSLPLNKTLIMHNVKIPLLYPN